MSLTEKENPGQVFPQNILDDLSSSEHRWRIAHTKSRKEKILAQFLVRHNIAYYLPMLCRRQPSLNRVRYSYVPLFTGYVFLKTNNNGRYAAMTSDYIAKIIEVTEQDKLLKELNNVQTALVSDKTIYPYDYVSTGQRVRIKYGSMKGVEGVIMRKKSGFRLVLHVSCLMQAVAMDVEADIVEPIDSNFINTNQTSKACAS